MKNCSGFLLLRVLLLLAGNTQFVYAEFSTSTAKVMITVPGPAVAISSGLSSLDLPEMALLDSALTSASSSFVVKTNSVKTAYDVWVSVPEAYLNSDADIYVALNSEANASLPLTVSLTGNTGDDSVNVNPAALQTGAPITARPATGKKSDGDGIVGTNLSGTTYTVTLTEDNAHYDRYNEIPAGTYTLVLMANVAQN